MSDFARAAAKFDGGGSTSGLTLRTPATSRNLATHMCLVTSNRPIESSCPYVTASDKLQTSNLKLLKQLESDKAKQICEAGHIYQLDKRDFPATRFAFYNYQRTHTLHSQHIKNKQG